jgi:cation transport protein ChaC
MESLSSTAKNEQLTTSKKSTLFESSQNHVSVTHSTQEFKGSVTLESSPFTIHQDAPLPELPEGDLWVFGYGSLMWRPDFEFLEHQDAVVYGYHRSLCVSSWLHRGTRDKPGLVLGLDKGGCCTGKLFRVCASRKEDVAQYLYGRELPTLVYMAKIVKVRIKNCINTQSQTINALTFVVDKTHPQYTSGKSAEQLAQIVSTTSGVSGHSKDYLFSTIESLKFSGISDKKLDKIASFVAT